MCTVSVIVPVYNAKNVLHRCLDSIACQTFADFEVLLINDGSTDESPAICAAYCEKDPRFKLITQKNAGPAAARNTGIDNSKGEYLAFVDSDDYIEPDMLQVLTEAARTSQAQITVYGFCIERGDSSDCYTYACKPGVYKAEACRKLAVDSIDIHTKNNIPPYSWVRFVQGDFLKKLDLRFDPGVYRSEDYLYWVQVHFQADCVCMLTDRALYHYVDNAASITHNYVKGYWQMAKKIYSHLQQVLPDESGIKARLDDMLVHRSLIAMNIASRAADDDTFKRESREILHDLQLKRIMEQYPFREGMGKHRAYYLLMKMRLQSAVQARYMFKRRKVSR